MPGMRQQLPSQRRQLATDIVLILCALAVVYIPVMVWLPLRTTGDEKVYIAQAVEMARHGTWFNQTLFDQPDYYKGPLLFVLIRAGMLLFGAQAPLALTYMNLLGYGVAAVAMLLLGYAARPQSRGTPLLAATLLVFACGAYAHALAAQMEALLIAAYAVFMACLGLAQSIRRPWPLHLAAWVSAGLAGWLKSPIHAGLLGSSALLYWAWCGDLRALVRRPSEWLVALVGVLVGVAGYLPAFVRDHAAFMATYVWRESLNKGSGNGVGIDDALLPFFTAHLLPWLPLAAPAVFGLWVARRQRDLVLPCTNRFAAGWRQRRQEARRLVALPVSIIVPTLLFFVAHPYRNGIYILPILPAVVLLLALAWDRAAEGALPRWRGAVDAVAALLLVGAGFLATIVYRFSPFPAWWGSGTSVVVLLACGLAALVMHRAAVAATAPRQVHLLLLACVLFYGGLGRLLRVLGNHESQDVAALVQAVPPETSFWQLNLERHLWSETGILNFVVHKPVRGLYTLAQVAEQLRPGVVFFVPTAEQLAQLTDLVQQQAAARRPGDARVALQVQPWRRWRMHGLTPAGEPTWLAAWQARQLTPLEREEYLVRVDATVKVDTDVGNTGRVLPRVGPFAWETP